MNSKKKKCLIFICALIGSIILLDFMLAQPSMRKIVFKEIHEGDYPIIVVGQSHAETAIDPYVLSDNEENKQAYNLARRLTSLNNMYYVIKEANRDGNVEKVYMEIDEAYWHKNTGTIKRGTDSNLLYSLSWRYKPEYFMREILDQNYNNAIFNYNMDIKSIIRIPGNVKVKLDKRYINRESEAVELINKTLHMGKSYEYKGRGFRAGFSKSGIVYDELRNFKGSKIKQEQKDKFEEICDYCKDNDIELVCFISALPKYRIVNENHDAVNEYFDKLCADNGVKFYDFNYAKSEYLGRTNADYVDIDGHMMGDLARRQTELLKMVDSSENPDEYFYDTYDEVIASFE